MHTVSVEPVSNGWIVNNEGELAVYTDLIETLTAILQEIDDGTCEPSVYDWHVKLVNSKKDEYAETIVVTRHKALLEFLKEGSYAYYGDIPVIEHATVEDVKGKHVVGVLPMHLACHAASITEVILDIPPELRGVELSTDQLRECYRGIATYRVEVTE
jgi:putative CRISPR-associated protein (TIGR02620 family)